MHQPGAVRSAGSPQTTVLPHCLSGKAECRKGRVMHQFCSQRQCLCAIHVGFPANNTCKIAQPPRYPFVTFSQAMRLFNTENVTSGPEILFDVPKAAAWFDFTNASSGNRHQVSSHCDRTSVAGLFRASDCTGSDASSNVALTLKRPT